MSGAVFLYAGMAVNNPGPTLWMFGLAFLATISREIIKDIQHLEGDRDGEHFLPELELIFHLISQ